MMIKCEYYKCMFYNENKVISIKYFAYLLEKYIIKKLLIINSNTFLLYVMFYFFLCYIVCNIMVWLVFKHSVY